LLKYIIWIKIKKEIHKLFMVVLFLLHLWLDLELIYNFIFRKWIKLKNIWETVLSFVHYFLINSTNNYGRCVWFKNNWVMKHLLNLKDSEYCLETTKIEKVSYKRRFSSIKNIFYICYFLYCTKNEKCKLLIIHVSILYISTEINKPVRFSYAKYLKEIYIHT